MEYQENIQLIPEYFIENTSKHIDKNKVTIECDFLNKVGTYDVKVVYGNISKQAKLIVQDTTPPKFKQFQNSLTVFTDDDVLSHFDATDISLCTLSILEDIDTSIAQDTIIHIQAIDPYQNKTIQKCHLIIKEKPKQINATIADTSQSDSPISIQESNQTNSPISNQNEEIPLPPIEIPACEYNGNIGNSGLTFNSYGEAIAYADSYLINNIWTYSGYSTEKIGCPDIWTVSFY